MKKNRTHVLMNAIGASGAPAAGGGSAAPAAAAPVAAASTTVPDAAAQAAVLAADQTRRQSIRASFAAFAGRDGVQDLQRQCEDDHSISAAAAGAITSSVTACSSTACSGRATG